MNNAATETAAAQYRRECREGRAVARFVNGYFAGVYVCETAEEAAGRATLKIGPHFTRWEILTRPVNILKALKAANAQRLADGDPTIAFPQALR